MLVPSLHYSSPNPHSVLQDSAFAVCTETRPWPQPEAGLPRRAGVSSFGIGGTNAHLVLEEAPAPPGRPAEEPGTWHVVPLSARSPAALAAQRQRLIAFLEAAPGHELRDIAFTLQAGRRHFAHRLGLVANSLGGLLASLRGEAVAPPPPALAAMVQGFEAGGEASFAPLPQARRVSLPGYPFERQRNGSTRPIQRLTLSRHRQPRPW
ncbi:ketoacyl-synthetase C-terminal extension domain-containing protein [Siccirubricoccus deserti]